MIAAFFAALATYSALSPLMDSSDPAYVLITPMYFVWVWIALAGVRYTIDWFLTTPGKRNR